MYLKHVLSASVVVLFMFLAWSSGPLYTVPCGEPKNLQPEPIQGSPNQSTDLIFRVLNKETEELIPGIYINLTFKVKNCIKIENCPECYIRNRVLGFDDLTTNDVGLAETSVQWTAQDLKDRILVSFTCLDPSRKYSSIHSTIIVDQNTPSISYTITMLNNESL